MDKYKHKLILYCKSFRGDLERANVLFESIKKHNKDNIPFYFQIPKSDLELFQNKIDYYIFITVYRIYLKLTTFINIVRRPYLSTER